MVSCPDLSDAFRQQITEAAQVLRVTCGSRLKRPACGLQIDCGDKYENEVVQKFNKCALSVNNCVPRRIDSVMEWPVGDIHLGFCDDTSDLRGLSTHSQKYQHSSIARVGRGEQMEASFSAPADSVMLCRCRQTMPWTRSLI